MCTLAVISEKGRKLKDFPVETNGQALVEAIRLIPGHKHLVFEEGLQSAWLYETLNPHVDEIVVAGITTSRGPKSDKGDAYGLAESLRVGSLDKHVFKAPRQFTRLRELSRSHMTLVSDTVRVQARIKALFRSRGILVAGLNVYGVGNRSSSDWIQTADGQWIKARVPQTRGLSLQHNHFLKSIFKGAATTVITQNNKDPIYRRYERLTDGGTKPNLAKLSLARMIAATVLQFLAHSTQLGGTRDKLCPFEEPNEAMAAQGPDGRMVPTNLWRTNTPTNRDTMRSPSNRIT